jgi:hypothetical protein
MPSRKLHSHSATGMLLASFGAQGQIGAESAAGVRVCMCARMQGVGGTCVLTGGCAFGAQRLCLRGPETFFASRLAACKAPRRCAQRRRSAAAPRGPTPTRSVLSWMPAPSRSLASPPPQPGDPPPPPGHYCVRRRHGCLVGWRTARRDSSPWRCPCCGMVVHGVWLRSQRKYLHDARMTPSSARALSRAQPKWEQAVRRVLRKDEHVVFAVIGGWVRAALCKRSWVAETLPPVVRIGIGARHILAVPEFTGHRALCSVSVFRMRPVAQHLRSRRVFPWASSYTISHTGGTPGSEEEDLFMFQDRCCCSSSSAHSRGRRRVCVRQGWQHQYGV